MRRHLPLVTFVSVVLMLSLVAPGSAAARHEIELRHRSFTPAPEIAPALLSRAEDSHLVIQFQEIPTRARREELRAAGITLLDYVPNYAWTAAVKGGALSALEVGEVRAVFELTPDDKISRTAIDRPIVRAYVYDDVEDPLSVLGTYGEILEQDARAYVLRLTGDLRALASDDAVKYVMGPRPEKIENNDDVRDNINADEAQAAPYNLSGNGLALGMWDNGAASTGHSDYASRLTVGDGSGTGSHPTLVCGVMAGDGTRSTAYGGSPYQWRGVATEADIASYSWPDNISNMNNEHSHAISNYDIILTQNSWSWGLCSDYCEYYGEYDDWSQNYDKIARGSAGKRISVVFSAGNDGDCFGCSGDIPDFPYGTIPGPGSTAKNAIVVGSNDADTDNLSDFSSMGPTLDGRLKPDVVAPGCKSSAGITTTYTSNNYNSSYCGTSFSAPAVSGCVALIQEDYIGKFGGEAWPSTVKALLIQGAEDQGNVGPDFQFGYGRVNIQNSIDVIRTDNGSGDLIKEDTLSPSETWEYSIAVTSGDDLKVTLVWDDFEADYSVPGATLVNDLDLELEAPGGATYYPWVLDPAHPGWAATTGVDDLNNVEQVEIGSPAAGTWTIRVTASVMPEPNQDFSIVTNVGGTGEDPPPAPPTGLGAIPGSDEGEIDLSWDPNSEPDLSHYRIERDDNSGFTSPASWTTDPPFYTDSGLTPGQTYFYRVFAVDAGGNESPPSGTASSDAQDLPPSAPTALNAWTGTGEGEIEIAWNPSPEPDVEEYRLERADNPGFSGSTSFLTPTPAYSDSGLTPGEAYYYRAFAIDEGGNESGPSNTDSATAQDLPPAPPTGLNAVSGTAEGEIDVTWNANSEPDFDHYRLERADNPGFAGATSFVTSNTFYDDSGLTPGDTYYYRVFAVDDGTNESDPSNTDSATARDLPPAAPTGVAADPGVGEGEIDVSWNASTEPDFDHYRLERDTDPGFPSPSGFVTGSTSFADSGLMPGTVYHYRVFAVDDGGNESDPSASAWAEATDLTPGAPTGLVAVTGTDEGDIDVTWDANPEPDIDYYILERDADPAFPSPDSFVTSNTYYDDSGLFPNWQYYYRVKAVDLGGNVSGPSVHDSAQAQDLPPEPPTNLVAVTGTGDGEIDVSWDESPEPDVSVYQLHRAFDPGFTDPVVIQIDSVTSHTDSGLNPGQTYYYRVVAVDNHPYFSDPSNTDSAVAYDAPPAAPQTLECTPWFDDGEIGLTWDPSPEPDFDFYRLERDDNPGFTSPTPIILYVNDYVDEGLVPGGIYYYRVFAIDTAGNESDPSETCWSYAADEPPAAPTGLTAVPGVMDGEIDVDWDDSPEPDADHYRLERADNPGFVGADSFIRTSSYFLDSGLIPDQVYYYRVFVIDDGANESDPSATASTPAQNNPPSAPAGLTADPGPGEGEISLDWFDNPEPDLDYYRIERATDVMFTDAVSFTSGVSDYVDSGLIIGQMYYYRVFAVDTGGHESYNSNTAYTEAPDYAPAAPTGLIANSGPGEGEITLSWNANSEPDFDHYRLERCLAPDFGPGTDPFDLPEPAYHDTGLMPGTIYYYRVIAIDLAGNESAPSDTVFAVAPDSYPSPPTGLTAVSGPGEGEIHLSWNANPEPDIDRYRLERATSPDFEPGSEPFETPATSYQDSGLVPGDTYYYRVIAIDVGGHWSDPGEVVSEVALDLVPTAPTGLTAVPGPGEGEIFISWNPNPESDIDHYLWERASNPEFEPGSEPFEEPAVSHQDSGLEPGETYYYRVSAVDATGNTSPTSDVVSAVALDTAPAAPTGLTASPSGDWDVLVSWDANTEPDLDRYRLERDTTDLFSGPVGFETTGQSHLDSGLDVGVTYYYRIFAIDTQENSSAPSDTVAYLFEGTGIPENLVASVSFVRPNPSSGEASVAYTVPSEGAPVSMSVYDIRGRLVRTLLDRGHKGGVYQATWDGRDARGEEVASGIYFFRVAVGDLEEVRKVVLMR
jgi:fibronectin type 3 domain-containing protein